MCSLELLLNRILFNTDAYIKVNIVMCVYLKTQVLFVVSMSITFENIVTEQWLNSETMGMPTHTKYQLRHNVAFT